MFSNQKGARVKTGAKTQLLASGIDMGIVRISNGWVLDSRLPKVQNC